MNVWIRSERVESNLKNIFLKTETHFIFRGLSDPDTQRTTDTMTKIQTDKRCD